MPWWVGPILFVKEAGEWCGTQPALHTHGLRLNRVILAHTELPFRAKAKAKVRFSFWRLVVFLLDVWFRPCDSDVRWMTRWDIFFHLQHIIIPASRPPDNWSAFQQIIYMSEVLAFIILKYSKSYLGASVLDDWNDPFHVAPLLYFFVLDKSSDEPRRKTTRQKNNNKQRKRRDCSLLKRISCLDGWTPAYPTHESVLNMDHSPMAVSHTFRWPKAIQLI